MINIDFGYSQLILTDDYLEFKWNSTTEMMTVDEFKEISIQYADFVEKHHPKKLLLDTVENKFIITPELQEWSNNEVFIRSFKAGLTIVAYLLPEDLVAQMSQEQLFDEDVSKKKANRYFSDKQEAIDWLLKQ